MPSRMIRRLARGPALRPSLLARALCTPVARALCTETVSFTFIEDGEEIPATAAVGRTLLEAAHDNDIDLEGARRPPSSCHWAARLTTLCGCSAGACDHSLACSTCHIILEQEFFDQLDAVDDEEMDMLDLAFGLQDTSRLGCQIKVTKALEGQKVTLPDGATNLNA